MEFAGNKITSCWCHRLDADLEPQSTNLGPGTRRRTANSAAAGRARTNRSAICVGFHDLSTHVWVPSSANKSELAVNARGWWRELKQRLFKTKTDFIWTSRTHASSRGFEGSGESDCRRNSKVGQRKSNRNVNSPATTIAQSCWLHSRFITVY